MTERVESPIDRAEIAARLKTFLEEDFPNDGVELTPTTDLLEEWFVDSLGITETVLFLEESFGVEITRADINGANFRDISTLSEFVAGRLGS